MDKYHVYDPRTGVITYSRTTNSPEAYRATGEFLILGGGETGETHYVDVDKKTLKKRLAMPLEVSGVSIHADGVASLKMNHLPVPCRVKIKGYDYTVNDGCFEWSTLLPGVYPVTIEAWPYLPFECEVTAVARDP